MKSFYGIRSAIQGKIKLSFYNLKKKIVCGGVGVRLFLVKESQSVKN